MVAIVRETGFKLRARSASGIDTTIGYGPVLLNILDCGRVPSTGGVRKVATPLTTTESVATMGVLVGFSGSSCTEKKRRALVAPVIESGIETRKEAELSKLLVKVELRLVAL